MISFGSAAFERGGIFHQFVSAASMSATPSTPSSDVSAMEYPVAVMATTTTRAFASTDRLYA